MTSPDSYRYRIIEASESSHRLLEACIEANYCKVQLLLEAKAREFHGDKKKKEGQVKWRFQDFVFFLNGWRFIGSCSLGVVPNGTERGKFGKKL